MRFRHHVILFHVMLLIACGLGCGGQAQQPIQPAAVTPARGTVQPGPVRRGQTFASHAPMRPLPTASQRTRAAGPARFVDAARGADGQDGSESRPWKTLGHAVEQLHPGDTLYLRGGIYYEHVTVTKSGAAGQPITIRSYPGELAIVDGGLREFYEHPETAWEPCPGGAAHEFRSTRTYPDLGGSVNNTNLLGHFADSMVPLHGYRFLSDLRSDNPYWNIENKVGEDKVGVYCGPGLYYDLDTKRIHVRLAPTALNALGADNYRGETDPRKLRLIVASHKGGSPLALQGVRHVRVQDLVVRGSRAATISVHDCGAIEFDGVTAYGGSSAMSARDTTGLRVWNCALRGIAAPWTFRGSLKYRAIEARIFSASGWDPTGVDNHDFELAYSEFTDCVDGVFIGNVNRVRFHHNLLDNVSDDGIFLTATTAHDGTTPGGDVHIYQNVLARCLTTFAFGVGHGRQKAIANGKQTGSGVHIFRNVFDFRRPVPYHWPNGPDDDQKLVSYGRVAGDHGGPTWEPMYIYHNTVISYDAPFRNFYGAGFGGHMNRGALRRVFNNIFVQVEGAPGSVLPPPDVNFQADGNLHWGSTGVPASAAEMFARFRSSKDFEPSKKQYAPGWASHDLVGDPRFTRWAADWRQPLDVRLQAGSPALAAGLPLPDAWPDPLRGHNSNQPDIGAIPLKGQEWRVGVRGRLTLSGAEVEPLPEPPGSPRPIDVTLPPRPTGKPVAIVEGYPAFDAPLLRFALRRQRIPVENFHRQWLDTKDYGNYRLVVLVGDLTRGKVSPDKYDRDDLARVQQYLENGGTLLLMTGRQAVFATPEGKDFLTELIGTCPSVKNVKEMQLEVLQPQHPWVKHLGSRTPAWLLPRPGSFLSTSKGEVIMGSQAGHAVLYRLPVGKGQLLYVGWDLARSLPSGRSPSTMEQEQLFEEQMHILLNLMAAACSDPIAK